MPSPQIVSQILSANQLFKQQYGRTVAWATAGALALVVLLILVMPEYHPTPYRLPEVREFIIENTEVLVPPVEEPPPTVQPPRSFAEIQPVPYDDPGIVDPEDLLFDPPIIATPDFPAVDDTPFVASQQKPRLIQGAVADYPEMARLAGLQGLVMVKVLVGTNGRVERVELLKGIHPLLDRPSLAAARKFVFEPGTQRDIPVACWIAVPFRFTLD